MLLNLKKNFTIKIVKFLDKIAFLWYTKHVNKLNTGMGISTKVALPSDSGEEIRVGSNPVTCTNETSTALEVVLVFVYKYGGI